MRAVSVSDAGVLGGLSHEAGVVSTDVSLADRLTRGLAEGLHVAPMRGIELVERCRVEWDARTEELAKNIPDLPSAGVGRNRAQIMLLLYRIVEPFCGTGLRASR